MTQQALTIRQDQKTITTELTARDVFNIWLSDQSELTRTLYESEVTAFLAQQGLDQSRPQILEFARHVVAAVIEAARVEERDTGLLELYAYRCTCTALRSTPVPPA